MKTRTKVVKTPTAIPLLLTAALVIVLSLILPIYRLWAFLLTAALSAGGFFALRQFFPDKTETVTENVLTGDQELDARILQAQDILARFEKAADASADGEVASYIKRIAKAADGIIEEVIQDPSDKADTYTFFSYYLPTMDKLLGYYSSFATMNGANAVESRKRIEDCLEMVASAFEKFVDKLYRSEAVEIKASVDVLKMMLRSDGLADKNSSIEDIASSLETEKTMEQKQLAQQ